jgi:hypothetical protein
MTLLENGDSKKFENLVVFGGKEKWEKDLYHFPGLIHPHLDKPEPKRIWLVREIKNYKQMCKQNISGRSCQKPENGFRRGRRGQSRIIIRYSSHFIKVSFPLYFSFRFPLLLFYSLH